MTDSNLDKDRTSDFSGQELRDRRDLLGDRIKNLRKQKGWTLEQASKETKLSIATLSKLENNRVSLGYDNLVKLGAGYKLDLASLMAPEMTLPPGDSAICRRNEGLTQQTPHYVQEYPFSQLLNRRMIPIFTRVKARSVEEFGQLGGHPGEEFLLVLEGAIDFYRVGAAPIRLQPGDSYYFDARIGHASVSVGIGDALILSVVTAPSSLSQEGD